MQAMILAAGRGNRLRPLTDVTPKPLIEVCGKPLIVYHLEKLQQAGIRDIVINVRHLGDKIQDYLGSGDAWGVKIQYSFESAELEVGGGIFNALPLLKKSPFIILNGDIWTDYPIASLTTKAKGLAYLVLVDNPPHNQKGDYCLQSNGLLSRQASLESLTYSGISILHPDLFSGSTPLSSFRLAPLLDKAALAQKLYGEHYQGAWTDVGTIERLHQLEYSLSTPLPEKKMLY
jgi:MurNAc alpha-1-phosphate uridylyltransferase